MAKWGKMEFGKKGPDGINGEGIDESSQGELYEKDNEMISQGDEIKKLIDAIIGETEEKSDFEKSLEGNTNSDEKSAEEYAKQIEKNEAEIEELDKDIKDLEEDVKKIFG